MTGCKQILETWDKRKVTCKGHCWCGTCIMSVFHFDNHLEKIHNQPSDVRKGTGIYAYSYEEERYYKAWHP